MSSSINLLQGFDIKLSVLVCGLYSALLTPIAFLQAHKYFDVPVSAWIGLVAVEAVLVILAKYTAIKRFLVDYKKDQVYNITLHAIVISNTITISLLISTTLWTLGFLYAAAGDYPDTSTVFITPNQYSLSNSLNIQLLASVASVNLFFFEFFGYWYGHLGSYSYQKAKETITQAQQTIPLRKQNNDSVASRTRSRSREPNSASAATGIDDTLLEYPIASPPVLIASTATTARRNNNKLVLPAPKHTITTQGQPPPQRIVLYSDSESESEQDEK